MELRQMQYFVTVCGLGNMSRAARQLFVSRQALSKSMAKLSEELGVPLFVPTARGVQPTEFARRFSPGSGGYCGRSRRSTATSISAGTRAFPAGGI